MICGGDFNANMGGDEEGDEVCGKHGTVQNSKAGIELRQLLNIHQMYSPMTFQRSQFTGTWIHPRSKQSHQLDHLFMEQQDKKLMRKCKISNMLVDSDHFSIRLHLSMFSPAGRKRTERQKRNGKDFKGRYGKGTDEDMVKKESLKIKELYTERIKRAQEKPDADEEKATPSSNYIHLQLAIEEAIETLPKRKKEKKGWYEGNEEELVMMIAKRDKATRKHAESKSAHDLQELRKVRTSLKRVKRKSKNKWWMQLLAKCNASVNPSKGDHKHPGDIWKTRKTIMTKGARWQTRCFKNVRNGKGEVAT